MRKLLVHLACLGVLVCTEQQAQADLVAHYTLDDGSGTIAADASGNGNDGIVTGNSQWATGVYGGAFSFDGATVMTLPADQMGLTSDIGSVVFWMNTDVPSGINTMFWAGDNTTGTGFGPENEMHVHLESFVNGTWEGGELSFYAQGAFIHSDPLKGAPGNTPVDPIIMGDNQWHHVAATWGDDFARLYIDGVLISEAGFTGGGWDFTNVILGRMGGGNRPYTGLLDDVRIFNHVLTADEVNAALSGSPPELSAAPNPEDKATDVSRDGVVLEWTPGKYAATHDVYFGTNLDDVNDAGRDNPLGVLVSENQSGTTYTLGRLELGQTYYWRVDEVNASPDTIFKGLNWQFTVEPKSSPIEGSLITATASSSNNDEPDAPSRTIDGSGLDGNDGHSTLPSDMWLSGSPDADPWIQYEFDTVYKLDRILLWNGNQTAESAVGWGLKNVQIEISLDGTNWTVVEGVNQLSRSTGVPGAGPTDDIDLGGIAAKYVRISITDNWGGLVAQYNLSEVRFYYLPVQAREPEPASGTAGVLPNAVLSWRSGREAGSHDVYVGTDANAVLDGSAPFQTVTDNSFDLSSLDLPIGETYYWKVNEVNDAEAPSVWEGPLWNFNIPDPLVVDDFEIYSTTNIAMRPYVIWRDGLDFSNPAPGGTGNGTGAIVGHDIFSPGSPFFNGDLMELTLIHGGTQSLPLYYDNSGNGGNEPYSEMTRTFSPAQDWSGNAIATLTLYFRGAEGNSGQLYVKINDTKVTYTDDPGAIARPLWKQWNIDLASTGATLSNVQSLTIGIENAGSGLVYVDDILLYRDASAVPVPADPGNAGLVASYSMENNVNDATGNYNGTATGTPLYQAGVNGMALVLDGVDDYVDLPIGSEIASLSDITITSWVNFSEEATGNWHRVFDFGTDTTNYMFLSTSSGGGAADPARFAILNPDVDGESGVTGLVALPTGWHHVAATIDSSSMTMALYVDGSVVGSGPTELLPQDLGETTQNWLGRSQWDADAYYQGALDEFLIYDRALSEAEIRYLAGEQ